MPVELTEETLRDAIAVRGERDEDGAQEARAALGWIGWHGEGPLLLRRYDVQLFCWYTLPLKFLASLDDKRAVAVGLARALEQLGGRAAAYAEICRSAETDELLEAWEHDEPAARRRLRELLDGSGIEPPDTGLLAWGAVMGLDEALAREQVAIAIEEAIEDGRLVPGAPGFKRSQAQIADAALLQRWEDGDRATLLESVHAERLDCWLGPPGERGAERRALLEPIAAALACDPPAIDDAAARDALGMALWLLDEATDGIALTQTGALSRALVREAVERRPEWWDSELFGPPSREAEVSRLHELHHLLRRSRLVRRRGQRLLITKRGSGLRDDPPALLETLAVELLAGAGFSAACTEPAAAAILAGATIDFSDALAKRIHPAILAQGWHSGDERPSVRDVGWHVADLLRPAEAIGILVAEPRPERRAPLVLTLTPAGRGALTIALRARALAPARNPF